MSRTNKPSDERMLLALSMYPLYRYFGGPRWAWRASYQHVRKVEFMNRNKQRNMLKMKREIGFHAVPDLLAAVPVLAPPDAGVELSYVVCVEYTEEGGAQYTVRSKDNEVNVVWRRGQHTRVAWNKLLERLGMHLKDFWLARYHTGTKEVTFERRVRKEEW
jgi:hypothetical protein